MTRLVLGKQVSTVEEVLSDEGFLPVTPCHHAEPYRIQKVKDTLRFDIEGYDLENKTVQYRYVSADAGDTTDVWWECPVCGVGYDLPEGWEGDEV